MRVVSADASVTVVVVWLMKTEAHAWPGKLKTVGA